MCSSLVGGNITVTVYRVVTNAPLNWNQDLNIEEEICCLWGRVWLEVATASTISLSWVKVGVFEDIKAWVGEWHEKRSGRWHEPHGKL